MYEIVAIQLVCIMAAVVLARLCVPRIAEERLISDAEFYCGEIATWLFRMPTAASGKFVPIDLYRMGDTTTTWYRRGMHLWVAAILAAAIPKLNLGTTAWGVGGLVVLAVLYAHLATIDAGESRLPNTLTQAASVTAILTVLLAGVFGGQPDGLQRATWALAGGVIVVLLYALLWVIQKDKLGWGDAQLSVSAGVLLGWHDPMAILYGFTAAWAIQGLVSAALLMVKITSRKAMLPLGPAIAITAFITPLLMY